MMLLHTLTLVGLFLLVRGDPPTKLHKCSLDQHQQQDCQVLQHYTDYQQVKCLTQDEIKELSEGKYVCESTHCWYADCQLRETNLGFQPIKQQCRCDEESIDFCKNSIDINKQRCMKLKQYSSAQLVTCRRSQDLVLGHSSGCPFPQTHCWHSCEAEKFHKQSGEVSDDCKCSAGTLNSKPALLTCLVVCLFSFLFTKFLYI